MPTFAFIFIVYEMMPPAAIAAIFSFCYTRRLIIDDVLLPYAADAAPLRLFYAFYCFIIFDAFCRSFAADILFIMMPLLSFLHAAHAMLHVDAYACLP